MTKGASRLFVIKIEGHKDDPDTDLLGRHKRCDPSVEGLARQFAK